LQESDRLHVRQLRRRHLLRRTLLPAGAVLRQSGPRRGLLTGSISAGASTDARRRAGGRHPPARSRRHGHAAPAARTVREVRSGATPRRCTRRNVRCTRVV